MLFNHCSSKTCPLSISPHDSTCPTHAKRKCCLVSLTSFSVSFNLLGLAGVEDPLLGLSSACDGAFCERCFGKVCCVVNKDIPADDQSKNDFRLTHTLFALLRLLLPLTTMTSFLLMFSSRAHVCSPGVLILYYSMFVNVQAACVRVCARSALMKEW